MSKLIKNPVIFDQFDINQHFRLNNRHLDGGSFFVCNRKKDRNQKNDQNQSIIIKIRLKFDQNRNCQFNLVV